MGTLGKDGGPLLEFYAITIIGLNLLMESIHHRLLVILNPQDYSCC